MLKWNFSRYVFSFKIVLWLIYRPILMPTIIYLDSYFLFSLSIWFTCNVLILLDFVLLYISYIKLIFEVEITYIRFFLHAKLLCKRSSLDI